MILHEGISFLRMSRASTRFLCVVALWNALVVVIDKLAYLDLVANPSPPVTMLGVAVAFYLGFKNTSAFRRWWEARNLWGEIVNISRDWSNVVGNLVASDQSRPIDRTVHRELIERHIAWLNTLALQLRAPSPVGRKRDRWMFGFQRLPKRHDLHEIAEDWNRFQSDADTALLENKANRAAFLLYRQSESLSALAREGKIDPYWHVALSDRVARMVDVQGKCERIKNTPFPRQVSEIGEVITWIFVALLPLAFNDAVVISSNAADSWLVLAGYHWLTLAPTSVLVCWVFFLTEKVSASMEDPFEGDVTDVPVSALCRAIEIDMRQMTGFGEPPKPMQPINDVLY